MTTESPPNVRAQLDTLRADAQQAHSGRAGHMLSGGPESHLTQTVIAMREGATLSEHENPGEATLLVLDGKVRLVAGETAWDGEAGDLLVVPDARHAVEALADSGVLLTAVKRV